LQNVVLLVLIYRFQGRSTARVAVVVSVLAAWAAAVTQGALQPAHLAPLYDVATTIGMASRLPQIAQNLASRSTGQLSLITYGLNTAGAAARIFTTLQEKNAGAAMLRGAVMSTVLNGILALQIVMYGKRGKGAKKGRSSARGRKKAT
jgi:mannose-P-dolichol utilization defect protein 1